MQSSDSIATFRIQTLEQLGMCLPIGIRGPSGLDRSLAVRPFSLREEKEIGKLRDRQEGNIATSVGAVLSVMLTRFGSHDFSSMNDKARRATISQAYMGDVYYAYIMVRKEALGKGVPIQVRCPACRNKAEIEGDLETLEIKMVEKEEDSFWEYELLTPLEIRGSAVRILKFGIPKWFSIERIPSQRGLNYGVAKAALIFGSLVGTDSKVVMTEDDVDGLMKRDLERITKEMDRHHLGPNMAVELECPACKEEIRSSMDWSYDSFFSTSSP